MPMIPKKVAEARKTTQLVELPLTRRLLAEDTEAEKMLPKTVAFGKTLKPNNRFVPPENHVEEKWLACNRIPRDLNEMDVVWKDITHLESVKNYTKWLKCDKQVK